MPRLIKNEMRPEYISISSLVPDDKHNSAPRKNMFSSSHIGQALTLPNATLKDSFTGMEREFGRFTFNIKFPCDAQIIAVIPKYEESIAQEFKFNPTTLIIYENEDTREVSVLECIHHSTAVDNKHQHFGYKFQYANGLELYPTARVKAGTVVADSPSKLPNGDYCYGVESNIAFMGIPGIIEDGIVVSESYVKRLKTYGYEKRQIGWGSDGFPLNLHPESGRYQIFPNIGEEIRKDGLLMAVRPWDYLLGPVDMAPQALTDPEYSFDKLHYAVPGSRGMEAFTDEQREQMRHHGAKINRARVVDVTVWHNDALRTPLTPVMMEEQPRRYLDNLKRYHRRILEEYHKLYKARKKDLRLTPEFHRQVVESMAYFSFTENPVTASYAHKENLKSRNVHKVYKDQKIEEWLVEIAFEYEVIPSIGAKVTDMAGNKGVICSIWPDSLMPTDADGNVAEVIMDPDSRQKRMNVGGVYEAGINAASRDVTRMLRRMAEIDPFLERNETDVFKRREITQAALLQMKQQAPDNLRRIWDVYLDYVVTCSQPMYDVITQEYDLPPEMLLNEVLADGIKLWRPTDNPTDTVTCVKEIREKFMPTFGPLTYSHGVTTEVPMLIGNVYMLLLEKTGSDFSAASSAKLQHFGIPSKVGQGDKFSSPGRNNPVRILGESEVRLLNAVVGSDTVADLIDMSNNPATHKQVVGRIHETDKPTQFARILDRERNPLGNARPLLFVRHILQCAGIKFHRVITDPYRLQQMEEARQEHEYYKEAETNGRRTTRDA